MYHFPRTFTLAALLFAVGSLGHAYGQYTITGTTAGGGNIVVGSGTGLGSIISGDGTLSPTGFDNVTFNPGSFATDTGADTVVFTTTGNVVINSGTVIGATGHVAILSTGSNITLTNNAGGLIVGGSGTISQGLIAVEYTSIPSIAGFQLTNHGGILGGNGGAAPGNGGFEGAGAEAIYMGSSNLLSNVNIVNTASVTGGAAGGDGGFTGVNAGQGGNGVTLTSGSISSVMFNNSGAVNGGAGGLSGNGGSAAAGGAGLSVLENADVNGVTVVNTGNFTGGGGASASPSGGPGGGGGAAVSIVTLGGNINNVILNNNAGLLLGGGGGTSGSNAQAGAGGNAFDLEAPNGSITGVSVTGMGTITGGNSTSNFSITTTGANGGDGIHLVSRNLLSSVMFNLQGNVFGGNASAGSGGNPGGSGGAAVFLDGTGGIDSVAVWNSGGIFGGFGGGVLGTSGQGGNGGNGITLQSLTSITNSSINNLGQITGNAGGFSGTDNNAGSGGDGILVNSQFLTMFTVNNQGTVNGAGGGGTPNGTTAFYGTGGSGIHIDVGTINRLAIMNSGSITGGKSGIAGSNSYFAGYAGAGVDIDASELDHSSLSNRGTIMGGIGFDVDPTTQLGGYGGTGVNLDLDVLNGFTLSNSGLIAGGNAGNGGNQEGDGGAGVRIETAPITNLTVINKGMVLGGDGASTGGYGGIGFLITSGSWQVTNAYVLNTGTIMGGTGYGVSFRGGHGAEIFAVGASGNINTVLDNRGLIQGGSGDSGGAAAIGLIMDGNGMTVNNWGAIAAGSGTSPTSIAFSGSNNTLNLKGHSSVTGAIAATGSANNVLNIAFSGLSPATQAALKAQIGAQGNLTNFSGTFTVRGVTYVVDPMAIEFNLESYQLQGLTPNQQAIGASLDSALVNPPAGSQLFNLFNAIDMSGNVPAALDALSPQKYAAYGDLAIANSSFTVQSVDARLNNLRDGSESIDTSGIGGDTVAAFVTGNSKDDSGKETRTMVETPAPKQWGFFATGDGLFFRGNRREADLQENISANTAGTIAGIDAKAGAHAVVGALFAYNAAAATLGNDGSHATIDSYSGGLYSSYHDDGFYANALAAYTRNQYTSNRNILIPGIGASANGSTNGNQETANLDGGYDWNATSRLTLGPVGGLQYVHLDVDGFNESGAGVASLAVSSQNLDSLQSRLGFHANYHLLETSYSSFAVDLHAAWQHEFLDDSRNIGAGFQGAGLAPFNIKTASPLRDAGVVGLGLNWTFHDRLTLFTEYELEFWRSSYFEQTINGGVRISF